VSDLRVYKPDGKPFEQDCDYWVQIRIDSRDVEGQPNAVTLLKVVSPAWRLK
jgi:hypothetical protein